MSYAFIINPNNFNPRSPRGERPSYIINTRDSIGFQSTLSARRATYTLNLTFQSQSISIHALREESDCIVATSLRAIKAFQSTLSARRATFFSQVECILFDISIHALREESDPTTKKLALVARFISIHALREERDRPQWCYVVNGKEFPSPLSARRATI